MEVLSEAVHGGKYMEVLCGGGLQRRCKSALSSSLCTVYSNGRVCVQLGLGLQRARVTVGFGLRSSTGRAHVHGEDCVRHTEPWRGQHSQSKKLWIQSRTMLRHDWNHCKRRFWHIYPSIP